MAVITLCNTGNKLIYTLGLYMVSKINLRDACLAFNTENGNMWHSMDGMNGIIFSYSLSSNIMLTFV